MKVFGTIALVIWIVGIIGWILNIVAIADSSFDAITGILVLRAIGVLVAPLGAVLGYI